LENVNEALIGHCRVCGRVTELAKLPGRIAKFCLTCSRDLATGVLLITEIDARTLAGRNRNELVSERRSAVACSTGRGPQNYGFG
jgi:hypothetical protein